MAIPAVAPWLLAAYISAETLSLTAERLVISDRRLPREFNGLKIAFATDLHHGPMCGSRRMDKMVQKINDFKPDIVLFGGDFLQAMMNTQRQRKYLQSLAKSLALLKPRIGSFAVLGNHDYYAQPKSKLQRRVSQRLGLNEKEDTDLHEEIARQLHEVAGINFIDNTGVWLKRGEAKIRLGGVGDLWFGTQNLSAARGDLSEDDFFLLLSHQPNFFDEIKSEDNVALVLAGHTHGGQFTGFNYLPVGGKAIGFSWRYRAGMVKDEQGRMLVSSGVGNSAPYVRFFAPPKIHLITLKTR